MNNKRVYYGMLGLVVVLVVVNFGAVYLGNTLLQKKSKELLEVKLDSQVLEGQQDSINQAKQDIDKYSELYKLANAIVPQDKDQAKAVREIVNIASANGVSLSTISFPASHSDRLPQKPSQIQMVAVVANLLLHHLQLHK